jgi:hypothetical protein
MRIVKAGTPTDSKLNAPNQSTRFVIAGEPIPAFVRAAELNLSLKEWC